MNEIRLLGSKEIPQTLLEIPQPPKVLYVRGTMPPEDYVYLCVVGSRRHTSYGRDICEKLIKGLANYPIVIVSGLAMGIDSIAHRAAMSAGLRTLSMPGSGLGDRVIYPRMNINLAKEIIKSGGCLMSEFEPDFRATLYSFPQRNRLMAGISKAVLIIEAEERSGTLITARMGLDYNKDILAVPGSAFSPFSYGPNRLIRQGATSVTTSEELLEALGFEIEKPEINESLRYRDCSPDEKMMIELLNEPIERDELVQRAGMDIARANALLSIMEIKGLIKEELGEIRLNT
jgi:DNA processing protein